MTNIFNNSFILGLTFPRRYPGDNVCKRITILITLIYVLSLAKYVLRSKTNDL